MKVVILCGLPGSGKSTFRNKYPGYEYINQDELGNRRKCIGIFKTYLKANKNVIIDRTNINKMQRKIWIDLAKEFGVKEINCVFLKVDPEECIKRIHERKNHPTIKELESLDKKKEIVYNFVKSFEMPEIEEGFDKILIIRN